MGLPAQEIIKFPSGKKKVLTVSELTKRVKGLLEDNLRYVWVSGEIFDLTYHTSGHIYFGLKDAESQVKCVIWRDKARTLKFKLEEGMEVVILGDITVYIKGGIYQLRVETIEPKGIGALQQAFEQLKEKLAKEGLFDDARKRKLPFLPSKIAIVTSIDGAAVRDILNTIEGRFPKLHILIYSVKVQGNGAKEEIAEAIGELNTHYPDLDVIIVGRGGGSLEDLWPFNEEIVARAIYKSRIPIISAVGHEVDYTIADFVADVRAKTPTDAGNIVVPRYDDILYELNNYADKLRNALQTRAELAHQILDGYKDSYAMRHPVELTHQLGQRLDDLSHRLSTDLPKAAEVIRNRLGSLRNSYGFTVPSEFIRRYLQTAGEYSHRMSTNILHSHKLIKDRLMAVSSQLDNLNPVSILARGYSVTIRGTDGKIIRDVKELSVGDEITSKLARGEVHSKVTKLLDDTRSNG